MTCAVGLQYREESQSVVLLGCDSCTVSDGVLEERIHSKLCRVSNRTHEYLLVGSGPSRKNDLLQTMIPPIYIEDDGSVLKYMITLFVNELRKAFKAGGLLKTENGKETVDGHTLVGFQGRLFQISMDFHISEHNETAIGSGREYGLASLCTSESLMKPEERITRALEAAARFDPYVAGPFHMQSLRYQG